LAGAGQQGVNNPRVPVLPHTLHGIIRYQASHMLEKAATMLKIAAIAANIVVCSEVRWN
jgi:hypothetical protein